MPIINILCNHTPTAIFLLVNSFHVLTIQWSAISIHILLHIWHIWMKYINILHIIYIQTIHRMECLLFIIMPFVLVFHHFHIIYFFFVLILGIGIFSAKSEFVYFIICSVHMNVNSCSRNKEWKKSKIDANITSTSNVLFWRSKS